MRRRTVTTEDRGEEGEEHFDQYGSQLPEPQDIGADDSLSLSSDDSSDDSDDPDYRDPETAALGQSAPPDPRVEDSRPVQGSPPPPPEEMQISFAPPDPRVEDSRPVQGSPPPPQEMQISVAPPDPRVEDSRPVQGSPNPSPPDESQKPVAPSSSDVLPPRRVRDKGKGVAALPATAEIIVLSDTEDDPATVAAFTPATEPASITPPPSLKTDEGVALKLKELRAIRDGEDASSCDKSNILNKCRVNEVDVLGREGAEEEAQEGGGGRTTC